MRFSGKDFLNFNARVMPGERDSLDCIADIANAKLREWMDCPDTSGPFLEIVEKQIREDERKKLLEGATTVFGHIDPRGVWTIFKPSSLAGGVHTAKLIDIKSIGEGEK